ncbi:ArsI/CadI family heavy metal resistance metalloenzyme [Streptosporangium sp. NPDC004631]
MSSKLGWPLKLVLIEGEPGTDTRLDHLGVEVASTDEVTAATTHLAGRGLATTVEEDTTCCYAVQDKVWVNGPGAEPWEVYVVKADANTLAKQADSACCSPAAATADGSAAEPADGRRPAPAADIQERW